MAYRATHGFGATPLADDGGSFCSFGVNWPSAVLPFVMFVCVPQHQVASQGSVSSSYQSSVQLGDQVAL
jgi:hypothetical protein